jgi:hypothetical protein
MSQVCIIQKHKFNINLLELSKSKDLQIAKTEWFEIWNEQRATKTGICICQHTLKNIIYMYNIFTGHTIMVGSGCLKKFNLKKNILNNRILKNVLTNTLQMGEYKIINNILEYTYDVLTQLIKHIRYEYENNLTNLEHLKELNDEIKHLIDVYYFKYLQTIYEEITNTIINQETLILERKEKEQVELERKEKARIELEKKRIEQIQFEIKENERIRLERRENQRIELEKEKKDRVEFEIQENERIQSRDENKRFQIELQKNKQIQLEIKENERIELKKNRNELNNFTCVVGITKKNICVCKNPKYELIKLSNNIYCIKCNKWTCRCKNCIYSLNYVIVAPFL